MSFKKTVLSNGLRILSESHPESRCAVVGAWVPNGTRHEPADMVGVSHLIEHMVFKGTSEFSAYDLARSLECVGGEVNAYTGREHTCFHTLSLSENLDLSIHVLSQLVRHANFDPKEFEKERKVIQQEILMSADDLEEYVYDLFFEKVFGDSSLGWPILGTAQSIQTMDRQKAYDYYKSHYTPSNMIVSAAGNVDHDQLVEMVEKELGGDWGAKAPTKVIITPEVHKLGEVFHKDSEQFHILASFPSSSYPHKDRFESYVLNTMLGGGMTSLLYQKVREERGLVYSIFSLLNTFTDCGVQTIYAGTDKENVEEVIDLIVQELFLLRQGSVASSDVEMYKTQARAQILIASEDIESRMNSIAINEMVFGDFRSVENVISEVDKVTVDSVNAYIEKQIQPETLGFFMLGPGNEMPS